MEIMEPFPRSHTPLLSRSVLYVQYSALKDGISPIHSGLSLLIKDAGGKRSRLKPGWLVADQNHFLVDSVVR